ncbi:hypothetical protein DFH08DRAFT_811331 [Mycena albidolilacea]|uniref:Uncharacterized protein n=1 Tax=Mycena albidolilacea TaxID=1033008 RepID=A0AAD7EPC2_9AGAR|nr:hypothetical protein DFH08DRAFT_811331 [Mycena albidolilacea]
MTYVKLQYTNQDFPEFPDIYFFYVDDTMGKHTLSRNQDVKCKEKPICNQMRTRDTVSRGRQPRASTPGCLSGSSLVLPPPAPPVDNSPPPESETQKDSEPTDIFASVVVGPPPRTLPPPWPPLPPPPPVTASSSTKSRTAGSKKAEPHATYTTPRGSTAEFGERWKVLEQEKPPSALFQKKPSAPRPSLEDIRKHINMVMGPSAAV